jgi:transcriptional regulator GlxA family with amidase domain
MRAGNPVDALLMRDVVSARGTPGAVGGQRTGMSLPSGAGPKARVRSLVGRAMNCLDKDRGEAWRCLRDVQTLLLEDSERQPLDDAFLRATIKAGGLAAWQVRRAIEYIEEHLGAKLGASDIAAAIGLSKGHFSRAFKGSIGTSPMAFVAMRRVERAKSMMRTSAKCLADVALACGFSDQSHLNKHFRRLVGSTPGRWRRVSE